MGRMQGKGRSCKKKRMWESVTKYKDSSTKKEPRSTFGATASSTHQKHIPGRRLEFLVFDITMLWRRFHGLNGADAIVLVRRWPMHNVLFADDSSLC